MTQIPGDYIALVDANDQVTGYEEKMKVHEEGLLHRAFSIFIFNSKGEMLLQKRAATKYHSPGLWTNTCCSHLLPEKDMETCAHERLQFEMGFDTNIQKSFVFNYLAPFDNGLTENEIDHVYLGHYTDDPQPHPDEVEDFKWIQLRDLQEDIAQNPEHYTFWFKHIIAYHAEQLSL